MDAALRSDRNSPQCSKSFFGAFFVWMLFLTLPYEGFAADTLGAWNVKQSPNAALGDGYHDDTGAIQAHIDSAYENGGGIVFFPAGNYLISSPLRLHARVYLKGAGGSTFGGATFDPGNWSSHFKDNLSCKITLASGSICNIIQTDSIFYQSGVEDIALVGNSTGPTDTNSTGCHGIHITDITDPNNATRSQAIFRNVIIYETKGSGFYDGANQHEGDLSYVMVMNCGWNGFTIKGMDCKIEHCGAGVNYDSGFYISTQGADRSYDVDAWSNNVGYELHDCINVFFFSIKANMNRTYGVYIGPGTNSTSYAPSLINFYQGTFVDNSTATSSGYSDIYLYSNSFSQNYGPTAILFHGCQFRGYQGYGHTKYPIEDVSVIPRSNVVSDCYFYASQYTTGKIINNNSIYEIRDCVYQDANGLGVYGANTMNFVSKDSSYQMKPYDGQVNASAQTNNVVVTLPDLNEVPVGTIFYVSRADQSTSYSLTVAAYTGQTVNGSSSVAVNGYLTTLMITQVGSQWRASKMVAP